jgi:hypothetical protein
MPIMPDGEFDRRIRAGLKSPLPGGMWELHTACHAGPRAVAGALWLARRWLPGRASKVEGAQLTTAIEAVSLAMRSEIDSIARQARSSHPADGLHVPAPLHDQVEAKN